MNSRYERMLQDYGFQVSESCTSSEYNISGCGVSFNCPMNQFPELFVQFCMNYCAFEELEKQVEKEDLHFEFLLQQKDRYEKAEENLFSLGHALIRAEKEELRNSLSRMNDVIWFLLAETTVLVWEDGTEYCIGWYTDFGKKFVIRCAGADQIGLAIETAFRSFSDEQYVWEQIREIESGERLRVLVADLIYESEQVYSALQELTEMICDESTDHV